MHENKSPAFGDFKEALTVLINQIFLDLVEGKDKGYQQHHELRSWILRTWKNGMSVQDLAHLYVEKLQ